MSKVSKKSKSDALAAALEALKKYGEGAIRKGSDLDIVESMPTGYPELDPHLVKDGAGLARGRLIEVFGPEGCGKCLTEETLCFSPQGLLTIREIFADAGLSCERKAGFVEAEYKLVNGLGNVETTSHFYKNGGSSNLKTVKVTTAEGFEIEGTTNHPVRVMNEDGFVVWRYLGKIRPGDRVCIFRGPGIWGDNGCTGGGNAARLSYGRRKPHHPRKVDV